MKLEFETLTGENCDIQGFSNKKHVDAKNKIKTLEKELHVINDKCNRNFAFYENPKNNEHDRKKALEFAEEQYKLANDIEKEISRLRESIDKGEFDIAPGYNVDLYTPSKLGFSFGNANGRHYIGCHCEHLPLDSYDENIVASEYVEGVIPETKIQDVLKVIKTDEESSIMFDSDIVFGTAILDDETTVNRAIPHVHDVMMINAENKKVCEILMSAKDPLSLSADTLNESINVNLSGRGKQNAMIICNHSAFSKLDIDIDGHPLVTRNNDSHFVYKNKYVIVELPDEILPNMENGSSPVIIGDMSIVKFFIMRDDSLIKDEFLEMKVHDRRLTREIIALATTSNSAYIHGTI